MVQLLAGGALVTVTVADPLNKPVHNASLNEVIVYTVVDAGFTKTVSGLLDVETGAPPFIE